MGLEKIQKIFEEHGIITKQIDEEDENSIIFIFSDFIFQQKLNFLVLIELNVDDAEEIDQSLRISVFIKPKYLQNEKIREKVQNYFEIQLKSLFMQND